MTTYSDSSANHNFNHDAAASIDLLPYVNALINARWWLLLALFIGALISGLMAYSKPYVYQSVAKVSVVDMDDPGGVSPDNRRASEVLTLVEHGFVMGTSRDNHKDVIRARLVSRDFTMHFIHESNIYRHFYPEQWDAENKVWMDGFTPDRGESFTRFRDEVRIVDHDEETDILTIKMNWPDPLIARDLANRYIQSFNQYLRLKAQSEVERKLAFLKKELQRSNILDIQQSIYRLIEAQTAIAMFASAREDFALEVIDPAATPYKSFNMSRKRKMLVGAVVGLLLAVFTVFAFVLLRSMWQAIQGYREQANQENNTDKNGTERLNDGGS